MSTDQKHLSDSAQSLRDQVIRCIEKIAWISGLDEQNLKVYSMLSREIRALDKKLDDYHSEYNSLKKIVKRLERDVRTQKIELENIDECVDRNTVVDLIYKIVLLSLINERKSEGSSYSFETSEESDSVEIIE
ncbi:17390_t:CDS:1, partial [Racocetra persica]